MRISPGLAHLASLLVLVAMLLTMRPKCCQAEWGIFRAKQKHDAPCRDAACPKCDYVCKFNAEHVDEQQNRFDVETKVICIPRVVFPWQMLNGKPCATNGARMRTVHVMTKENYSCPKCHYTWNAIKRKPEGAEITEDRGN